jgi:hypothetical protein
MTFDTVIGAIVLLFGYLGTRTGIAAQVYQLLMIGAAGYAAKLLTPPTAGFLSEHIEWTPALSAGICFLCYFFLLLMVAYFVMDRVLDYAREAGTNGRFLDVTVGGLVGISRSALLLYSVLCGLILIGQDMGGEKPVFAVQYQNSRVASFTLTHNYADVEPFPFARVFRALIGAEDPEQFPHPGALQDLRVLQKMKDLLSDPDVVAAIRSNRWKHLRRHAGMLALLTDPRFLQHARFLQLREQRVEAEDPNDRFRELRDR